ncbi:Dickkopf N-terminal cysteine-rich domain-containing protein [Archangium lansingense]|uniref:Dickkopf N-terminal cysteine-rich domain-containing protein n=1 Tax=Archangium lansingense TaxID=2995310 RepID=A0ABT4A4A4_9BACT|nr:Dickkopf N-terminal cysteine-rich domain-containing protein [Archangium lansinium]MCY1075819.1 hypothetical protein [Archangium lansinium]
MRTTRIDRTVLIASVALMALTTVACREKPQPPSEGPPTDPVALQDYCAQRREADCRNRVRCGEAESVETCLEALYRNTAVDDACMAREAYAVARGHGTYDAQQARTCLNAYMETAACHLRMEDLEECRGVFAGSVPVNGACEVNEECTPDAYCDLTADACPGTCRSRKEVGQPAADTRECAQGLYRSWNGMCAAPAQVGESCASSVSCVHNAFCNSTTELCEPQRVEGEACKRGYECMRGLACPDGTCVPLRGPGESCENLNVCKADLSGCVANSDRSNTCTTAGAEGEKCFGRGGGITYLDRACQRGLFCESYHQVILGGPGSGSCARLVPEGGACAGWMDDLLYMYHQRECEPGLHCATNNGGTCQQQLQAGAACDSSVAGACVPGLSCIEGRCGLSRCATGP